MSQTQRKEILKKSLNNDKITTNKSKSDDDDED